MRKIIARAKCLARKYRRSFWIHQTPQGPVVVQTFPERNVLFFVNASGHVLRWHEPDYWFQRGFAVAKLINGEEP